MKRKTKELTPIEQAAQDLFLSVKSKDDLKNLMADLMRQGIEAVLRAEIDDHLGNQKNDPTVDGNYRNGSSKKTVKSSIGDIALSIPRDRQASFEPQIVGKHDHMIDQIEDAIIGLYARGKTTRDIEDQVRALYHVDVSESTISSVTSRVVEYMKQWQNRPLERLYCVVFLDCIMVKVRDKSTSRVTNKAIYLAIGINKEGHKDVLGMWINGTESATFWGTVLTDLKVRGVEDILIASTDNLKGFTDAIKAIFPQTETQLCIVHQLRASLRYVSWKDKKAFAADLKKVYSAPNESAAREQLEVCRERWGEKYPLAIASWERNWDNLTVFFQYPPEIRHMIYTTNAIESLNSIIRKYTKAKTQFPDDTAAMKAICRSITIIEQKWSKQLRDWPIVYNQFMLYFEDRIIQ